MLPRLNTANALVDEKIGTDTERNIGGWTFTGCCLVVFSRLVLELVSGDGLFVDVLSF